jgi:hypothetical protein
VVLARLHANKSELLIVLERPEVPLHTNGSENDIRAQVTKRKISRGTRSEAGRACRDAFLELLKTCRKRGISFWHDLGAPSPMLPPCRPSRTSSGPAAHRPDRPGFWPLLRDRWPLRSNIDFDRHQR